MLKKDIRKQILIDSADEKLLAILKKTKRYGSSDSEILRRGLQCLAEQEKSKGK